MSHIQQTGGAIELLNKHGFNAAIPIYFHLWGGRPSEWYSDQVSIYAKSHPLLDAEYTSRIEEKVSELDIHSTDKDQLLENYWSRGYFDSIEERAYSVLKSSDTVVRFSIWWAAQRFLRHHVGYTGSPIISRLSNELNSEFITSRQAVHRKSVFLNVEHAFDEGFNDEELKRRLAEAGVIWSRKDANAYPNTPQFTITTPVVRAVLRYFDANPVAALEKSRDIEYRRKVQMLSSPNSDRPDSENSIFRQGEHDVSMNHLTELIQDGAIMVEHQPRRKRNGRRSQRPARNFFVVPYQVRETLTMAAYNREAAQVD